MCSLHGLSREGPAPWGWRGRELVLPVGFRVHQSSVVRDEVEATSHDSIDDHHCIVIVRCRACHVVHLVEGGVVGQAVLVANGYDAAPVLIVGCIELDAADRVDQVVVGTHDAAIVGADAISERVLSQLSIQRALKLRAIDRVVGRSSLLIHTGGSVK